MAYLPLSRQRPVIMEHTQAVTASLAPNAFKNSVYRKPKKKNVLLSLHLDIILLEWINSPCTRIFNWQNYNWLVRILLSMICYLEQKILHRWVHKRWRMRRWSPNRNHRPEVHQLLNSFWLLWILTLWVLQVKIPHINNSSVPYIWTYTGNCWGILLQKD